MRFQIVDAHGLVILEWDVAEVARTAHPHRLRRRKRARFEKTLTRVLEQKKLELFST